MNAKTTATRAKSNRAMDTLIRNCQAQERVETLSATWVELFNRRELLEWMDRTPAERQRRVKHLKREERRVHIAWQKARDKCERLSAK